MSRTYWRLCYVNTYIDASGCIRTEGFGNTLQPQCGAAVFSQLFWTRVPFPVRLRLEDAGEYRPPPGSPLGRRSVNTRRGFHPFGLTNQYIQSVCDIYGRVVRRLADWLSALARVASPRTLCAWPRAGRSPHPAAARWGVPSCISRTDRGMIRW